MFVSEERAYFLDQWRGAALQIRQSSLMIGTDNVLRISPVALRWADQTHQETLVNDRLRVASILLGHLITCDQGKDLRARLPEVRHCIDLADLLIGLCETSPPACAETGVVGDGDVVTNGDEHSNNSPLAVPPLAKQIYKRRRARLQSHPSQNGPALH